MVSLRRRKLLGLCSGKSSFLAPFTNFLENGAAPQMAAHCAKLVVVHSICSDDLSQKDGGSAVNAGTGSSNIYGSSSSKVKVNHHAAVKRRKRHRRKAFQNQEPCLMRGVYFKNMKWQAAIKVDKKQIHLGTVGSQEEAARLYDRAAFMCGRDPNFELSEEEKERLRKFKWDEFLTATRNAITNKKHKRKHGSELHKSDTPSLQSDEHEGKQRDDGVPT